MKLLLIAAIVLIALAPAADASKDVHKCYGTTDAGACVDYEAVNDVCVEAHASAVAREECVQFIGPVI